ncbi:MAG: choice-of-anchor B family protein [Phycisphaerae bacterium]
MLTYRTLRRSFLAAALTAACGLFTAPVFAHEDPKFLLDRQPPYVPAGFNGSFRGAPSISFPASGIELLSWLPLGDFGGSITSGNDSWGYVSPSGREYAIIGLSDGTGFVEVTSPSSPQIIAVMAGPNSLWRDIKTYQNFAYAVSEGGSGIQVFDLSQIDSGIVTLANTVTTGGVTASHNIAIDEASGFLYRCGGGSGTLGLRIYDLNPDPSNPTFVGQWNTRYIHDAQIVTYTSGPFAGKQVAFCFSETGSGGGTPGVDILDVTNKTAITQISFFQYSSPVFSHQGWLSPDRQFLYTNDELDEQTFGTPTTTRVIDVSDLNNPVELPSFTNGNASIDHNLYTVGNLIFESNYRSGLRVYDATNPAAPVEIGFFDTYPPDDNPDFNGLWNNYPFLPSGIVIGSDLEKGLFIWWIGAPQLLFTHPNGLPPLISPNGQTIRVQVDVQNGGTLAAGSLKLHYDAGAGFVTTDLIAVGGNQYDAVFPPLTCGAPIAYYFSGMTTNNITWRDPSTAPAATYQAIVATGQTVVFTDDFETNQGWTVGAPGDTAVTGIWTRVDPVGTAAQPENDHTADPAVLCFVTGQGAVGGGLGANDVDGGQTTLLSPTFDASQPNTIASYWRWFSNDQGASPNEDAFIIDISNDNGATWTNAETVGPTGPETAGGWFFHQFIVSDVIAPTSTMKMRFVAADLINGSIVEAAVDDFDVSSLQCAAPCPPADGDLNLDTLADGNDVPAFVTAVLSGPTPDELCAGDFTGDSVLDAADIPGFVAVLTTP